MKQHPKRLLDPHGECPCILDQAEPDFQRLVASVSGGGLGRWSRKAWRQTFRKWVRNLYRDICHYPGFYASLKRGDPCLRGFSQAIEIPLAKNLVSLRRGERLCLTECRTCQRTARVPTGAKLARMCGERFVVGASAPQGRAEARTTKGPQGDWSRCVRRRACRRLTPTGGHAVENGQEYRFDAVDLAVLDLEQPSN